MLSHLRVIVSKSLGARKILPRPCFLMNETRGNSVRGTLRYASTAQSSQGLLNIEAKRYAFSKQIVDSLQPIRSNLSYEPKQAQKEALVSPLFHSAHAGNEWFEQSRSHTLNNNPVKALECIAEALASDPHNALYLQEKAQLLFARRQFSDASELYDRILREGAHPALDTIWYNKALAVYAEKDDLPQALRCVTKALELNPRAKCSWLLQSQILNHLNRPAEALRAADELFRLDPDDQLTWQWTAELLADMGNIDEANRWYYKLETARKQ